MRFLVYEKFKSLPNAKDYLKPGIDFEILDKAAYAMSDNDSAELLQKARNKLFKRYYQTRTDSLLKQADALPADRYHVPGPRRLGANP